MMLLPLVVAILIALAPSHAQAQAPLVATQYAALMAVIDAVGAFPGGASADA
jgi:hypothetical protein